MAQRSAVLQANHLPYNSLQGVLETRSGLSTKGKNREKGGPK
jgi:hypothetical protein